MANYYVSSVKHAAVAQFAISTAYSLGNIVRQLAAPSVGNERCFRCTTAGTTGGSESAWTLTKNGTTNQGTAVFTECTGQETYQTTAWLAPFARLNPAVTSSFSAAGDTIFVASNHAETQTATMSLTGAGTVGSPQRILCVTVPSSAIPPTSADLTTGASATVTTGNTLTFEGSLYAYGLTLFVSNASGAPTITVNSTAGQNQVWDHCTFKFDQTSGNSRLLLGQASGINSNPLTFLNCTLSNAGPDTALAIRCRCPFNWYGGSLTSGVASLFVSNGSALQTGNILLHGVDLSALSTSQNIMTQPSSGNDGPSKFEVVNCKLVSSYPAGTIMSGTIQGPGYVDVDMITSESSGQGAREEHYRYQGSIVADLSNYRNGGASDGVSSKSWKMVSTSGASYINALYAPDLYTWLPSAGTYTLTMYLANTSALTLTDAEFGFDYFWMGTSGNPLATMSVTQANPLAAGSALTTDGTSTWTGLASPVKQKIAVTIVTTEPGFVRIRPRLNRASTTVYVDPLVVVS